MIAEYSDQQPTGGGTSYLTADHLGTPRVITRANGSVSGRHDYQPFGEEISASHGGRASVAGYPASDGVRQQFTLKERDIETGLDYFLARYYSPTQGRFITPDEFSGGPTELFAEVAAHNPTFYAELSSPQTLNKYQYTLGNPLRFVDPDGHQEVVADLLSSAAQNPTGAAKAVGGFVGDYWKGELKALGNIGVGAWNIGATAAGRADKIIQPFEPAENTAEEPGYKAMSMLTLLAPALSKAGPAGVLTAEAKQTTVVVAEAGNAGRTASATIGTVERTAATVPYARPSGATTPAQRAAVQGRPCSVCGESAPKMYAGHKEALVKEYYRTGTINRTRMRSPDAVRAECPTCSNREGAQMRQYSMVMRNQIPK